MLDSLYEKALRKKNKINERIVNNLENIPLNFSKCWIESNLNESKLDITIGGGDGSINKKNFLSFIFYAIDAECLIHNSLGLQKVESSDIDIISYHKYVRDRLRNYMGIFEIKNALKAFDQFDLDLFLFDGSILGNLIRPFPLETELQNEIKEEIKIKYFPKLEKELEVEEVEIVSLKMFDSIEKDFKDYKTESMIYLENLENLLAISKLLRQERKIVAISKTSTRNDYFDSNIPDMAIFERFNKKEGYSKPLYLDISKEVKRDFPILNVFFRKLNFTIFYTRLEDYKNILKIELPYKANEEDIRNIIEILKGNSTEGYPYLLKKAHNDVVIRKID
ncbi:MAG: DNA double-strand break repair nuclease NurA, partial [Euryarchaeota archaeon]|nr:DNA double-strand break repair nuclease NurA [Euryarchaeota archaeon]